MPDATIPEPVVPYLDQWLGPGWTATALAGDASVRAYYRVRNAAGQSFILSYYPEEVRGQLARTLASCEAVAPYARVPRTLHHCEIAALQEDAGETTVFEVLHRDREEGLRLYRAALHLLGGFHRAPDPGLNAPFTAQFFRSELDMAREFYVERLLGTDSAALEPHLNSIADKVSHHPYVLCHRDYHGQNIHVINDTLLVIDYQDLRLGPDTYDLASLLRDRGVARIIGDDTELELIDEYARITEAAGDVRRRYFETLLQRSIKILGTFARQPIVRGRMHYLEWIPATLESVARCAEELPEYRELRDIFPLAFDLQWARERARQLNADGAREE